MIIAAPSLANCDLFRLAADVNELAEAGLEWMHIDVMDGHYVPNLCLPISVVADLKRHHPQLKADVHLMVTDPLGYVERLCTAGADAVSFHLDATGFARRVVSVIQEAGMQAGIVLNPSQRVDLLEPVAPYLDFVTLMTVEPGVAGQPMLPGSYERLSEVAALRDCLGANFRIQIDGGVTHESAREYVLRGADILTTGKYVTFDQPEGITVAVAQLTTELADAEAERDAIRAG